MSRLIRVRVPEIHDRATGGSLANRGLIAALRRRADVRVRIDRPDDGTASPGGVSGSDGCPDEALTLVDSLRIGDPGPGRSVLLAHYLHCVDPEAEEAETAERERSQLEDYAAILAPSEWVRDRLRALGVSADRVFAWTPGLDERFRGARAGSEPGFSRTNDPDASGAGGRGAPSRLLTVASVIPGKHHDLIPEVASEIADRAWRWTLVGDEELYPDWASKMRDRFARSELADRFTWRGVVDPSEIPALYEEADLFVLPSRFETLGLAVREAMAMGCPPVAFRTGGIPESVTHEETGLLAGEPGSAVRLAEAVNVLLADPERRRRMGRAARAAARSFPDWDESADRLLDILDRVSELPPKQSP